MALILFLQSRRVATAEQMATHFELSVRTIYRDLAALGQAGVPIVAEAGVGYTLMKGYHLPPVNFTTEEANALIMCGLLIDRFADSAVTSQIHSALLKVRAILPREQQERVARLERAMTTTANVKPVAQADLSLLQQALAQQSVLQFDYQSASQTKRTLRTVHPLGLIYYLERWHLIGWCRMRRDYRDFRTDRISNIRILGETFDPPKNFDLADYMRESMPAPALQAQVMFDVIAADRAKREWWQGIINEQHTSNGILLTLGVVEWPRLVGWLLSFGTSATVVAPEELREQLVQAGREVAAHHNRQSESLLK